MRGKKKGVWEIRAAGEKIKHSPAFDPCGFFLFPSEILHQCTLPSLPQGYTALKQYEPNPAGCVAFHYQAEVFDTGF